MAGKRIPDERFTNTRFISLSCFLLLIGVLGYGITSHSQQSSGDRAERFWSISKEAEELSFGNSVFSESAACIITC